MNYRLGKKIWTIYSYIMWFGLILSVFMDGKVLVKLGIVVGAISCTAMVKLFEELDRQQSKKSNFVEKC